MTFWDYLAQADDGAKFILLICLLALCSSVAEAIRDIIKLFRTKDQL